MKQKRKGKLTPQNSVKLAASAYELDPMLGEPLRLLLYALYMHIFIVCVSVFVCVCFVLFVCVHVYNYLHI